MARHSKSSKKWLREHETDEYVLLARREGLRSRAVYKLAEINERDRLLRPGMTVVDLGAAPGGWSEYCAPRVGPKGRVFALDILDMVPIPGVEFICGDFGEQEPLDALHAALDDSRVDLVLSDMAPNLSGVGSVDQARAMYLVDLALDFAEKTLRPGGDFLIKLFQGEGFVDFHRHMKAQFGRVLTRKPQASRARSRELYLLGRDFKSR